MKEDFKWDDRKAAEFSRWVIGKLTQPKSPEQLVKEFKEFKQPKKDWEILAFYDGCINGHKDVRCITLTSESITQEKVIEMGFTIHSIKRLSDGEVFSINDTVYYEDKNDGNESFIIGCIRPYNDDLHFYPLHPPYYLRGVPYCGIKEIKKHKKQPLFTTTDGVDIYEGDDYWYVNIHVWKVIESKANKAMKQYVIDINKYETFSTEKAALNYLFCNKPCLSFNDVWLLSDIKSDNGDWVHIKKQTLKQLAKQKIQNNHE